MFKIGNMKVYGVIYKITNRVNGKVYIGQTVKGFKKRYHYKGNGIEKVYRYYKGRKSNGDYINEYLVNSIEKYGFENFEVCEIYDVAFSEKELNCKEKLYIELYKSDNRNFGYNHQKGGYDHSINEETRKKMSDAKKGMYVGEKSYFFGKHHTEETKKKISDAKKGVINDKCFKKVICLNTKEIFDSLTYACKKYNLDASNMVKALKNNKRTCGKLDGKLLRWQYYDDYLKNPINSNNYSNVVMGIKIICLNDGNIFDSLAEASNYYKCDASAISKVCKGIWKHTHKLRFMYYSEYKELNENKITNHLKVA